MKALVLTQWTNDATYFYRLKPLFYIDNSKIKIEKKPYQGDITYSFFDGYTHLIMERPSGHNDLQVIKLAKQCGLKVISDWDDDCLHLDAYNPMYYTYENGKQTVIECIAESDEVWVSTEGVRRSYHFFNRNIHVIPNAHNDYLFPLEKKKEFIPGNKTIFWRGGESHLSDVYACADEIIKLVNGNMDWQFYFIGCRFIYLEQRCGMNYNPVSTMPLMQYFNFMGGENPMKLTPSVVFHPLSDTIFNKSKSNISWLESSYVGSVFFGNKKLPEFNHDYIYPFEAIGESINSDELAEANIESWGYIQKNLLLSKVNKLRIERLLK